MHPDYRYPFARRNHTLNTSIDNKLLLLYGGYIDLQGSTDEMWRYEFGMMIEIVSLSNNYHFVDTNRWQLQKPTGRSLPRGRHCHSSVTSSIDNRLYIYGGLCNLVVLGDFHIYHIGMLSICLEYIYYYLESNRWESIRLSISNPGTRYGHACCTTQSKMFIYGGCDAIGNYLNDLWCYDYGK